MELVCFLYDVLEASLLMTPLGQNMYLNELLYKVVSDGYLFITYFRVQHNGMLNFKVYIQYSWS